MLLVVAVGAVLLLVSIPFAQWLALARPRTARWVPVNAAAWAVAILWTLAPSPFIDERSPVLLVVGLYAAAGVLMAVTFACLTAPLALRLFFDVPGRPARVRHGWPSPARPPSAQRSRGPAQSARVGADMPTRDAWGRRAPCTRDERHDGDRRRPRSSAGRCWRDRADGIRARRVPSAARSP